jgi:hypothetical protein
MISLSSSTVFPLVGVMLTGEFTSLDEPSEVVAVAVYLVDVPEFIGSDR